METSYLPTLVNKCVYAFCEKIVMSRSVVVLFWLIKVNPRWNPEVWRKALNFTPRFSTSINGETLVWFSDPLGSNSIGQRQPSATTI